MTHVVLTNGGHLRVAADLVQLGPVAAQLEIGGDVHTLQPNQMQSAQSDAGSL